MSSQGVFLLDRHSWPSGNETRLPLELMEVSEYSYMFYLDKHFSDHPGFTIKEINPLTTYRDWSPIHRILLQEYSGKWPDLPIIGDDAKRLARGTNLREVELFPELGANMRMLVGFDILSSGSAIVGTIHLIPGESPELAVLVCR